MADLDALYSQLAAGGSARDLNATDTGLLLARAQRALRSDSVDERRTALRVAETIGGRDGFEIVGQFGRDPDLEVRREVLRACRDARETGLPALRELAADADEGIATAALDLLLAVVDKASTRRARLLLESPNPTIRSRAARLLGNVGGPAIRPDLSKLLEDPDENVRSAAAEALDRLAGKLPKATSKPWWEVAPPAAGGAAAPPASGDPAAPPSLPIPSKKHAEKLGKSGPVDAADLLRRLGRDGATAPPSALLDDLRTAGERSLSNALRLYRPGSDPWLARGLALAARHLPIPAWTGNVGRLLKDPDPAVRAAAAESLGAVGKGMSVLQTLTNTLADADPQVRAAAARGIGALCATLARPDLVKQRLDRIASDPDESVRRTRDEVLAGISG
jgi:hypothetical protein